MTEKFYPEGIAPVSSSTYPTWSPAVKDAVGTALGSSRVWFTVARGIIAEGYFQRLDIPQLKDLGFIVANGTDFWIELRRLSDYTVDWQDDVISAITSFAKVLQQLRTAGRKIRASIHLPSRWLLRRWSKAAGFSKAKSTRLTNTSILLFIGSIATCDKAKTSGSMLFEHSR